MYFFRILKFMIFYINYIKDIYDDYNYEYKMKNDPNFFKNYKIKYEEVFL